MKGLSRLVPLLVAAWLMWQGEDEVLKVFDTAMDMTYVVGTRLELQGIGLVVSNQAASDNLPADVETNFGAFLHEHLRNPAGGDVGEDPWGGEYRFRDRGDEYVISSAGPDWQWGTGDDLTTRVAKR